MTTFLLAVTLLGKLLFFSSFSFHYFVLTFLWLFHSEC
uniref:Uncharacterized protein MANES_06G118500 n=1 Tax=Rhizophora mucronata TaxID=61149 RepID=A0A2P2LA12_RHIMU